jgi:PAS domain S-box-containing protein
MMSAKILVVEDDRVVALDIQQQLISLGHTVVATTSTGEEAVALAASRRPDLVLMDIRLAGPSDGIDAARQIRERWKIPVIYLTAYADDNTLRRASVTEPWGYLLKPFDDSQLRTVLEMALYRRATEAKLQESEHRFAVTLASIGDAVIATDNQANIRFMNPVAERLTGWSFAQALGKPLSEVFRIVSEETGAAIEDPAAKVFRLGVTVGLANHTMLIRRDGHELAIDDSGAPIRDERGDITGVVLVFRDVTQRRQAEQAAMLREVNARVQLALQGSSVGLWDFDMPDGVIDNARSSAINFWEQHGYDPNVSLTFAEVALRWHPDDRDRVVSSIRSYLAGETTHYEVVCRILRSDGGSQWRLVRGVAVRDASGKPIRFTGSSFDITDRLRIEDALRESEERFRGTFESAGAGIVHVDFETPNLVRVNDRYCEMTGYTRDEVTGKSGVELTHPDDWLAIFEEYQALTRGELTRFTREARVLRKDGSSLWTSVTTSRVHESPSSRPYAVCIVEDISERKRLEEELRRARDVAEAGNRAKDEFLANVSHEIRTPMNAILGMSELMLDTPLNADQQQLLRTVKSAAGSLLAVINDLLDFSKIEAGKLALDPTDFSLRPLFGDAMRALAVRAHRKGLELVCNVHPDVPDALHGDASRLRQVLVNLVGNAIKFTASGEVVVDVETTNAALAGSDVELRFTIRDTGIGISKEQEATIFRAFEQADASTTRKYGGTGLGLTIAARLVFMMGGEIHVDSQPGRGSTFVFTAVLGRNLEVEVAEAPLPPRVLRGLRVLIVDDNAINRRILEGWLRGWKIEPTAVGDGVAAMDALWHGVSIGRPYTLALLDARMPDTDGLTLAGKIRERAELAGTHIILLTSGERPGDFERSRELKVSAHVLKPVPHDELLEAILQAISRPSETTQEPVQATPSAIFTDSHALTAAPLRVLVAEDNQANAQLLQRLLLKWGHAVRLASNGREALALARSGAFDIVLLDLHMPELDGLQVVEALRAEERPLGRHLPVIALTARSRPEDRVRCLAAGMDEFVTKPIQAATLQAAISRAILAHDDHADGPQLPLISAAVLLAACGSDAHILEAFRDGLRLRLPEGLAKLDQAFEAHDMVRLSEAAHSLAGWLAAFSTRVGALASELEEQAARARLAEASTLIQQLHELAPELLSAVEQISIESLQQDVSRAQARTSNSSRPAG